MVNSLHTSFILLLLIVLLSAVVRWIQKGQSLRFQISQSLCWQSGPYVILSFQDSVIVTAPPCVMGSCDYDGGPFHYTYTSSTTALW